MSETKLVAKKEKTATVPVLIERPDPMSLIQLAISSNADMDKLERLMAMQERWTAQKAKESFLEALSNFQYECPEIKKSKSVNFTSEKTGRQTNYKFATLGDIDRQIKTAMKNNGLSKRWEIKEEGDKITVTCLITHKDGHTERTALEGKADDSGGKNSIQQRGSTVSYLERYSLLGALGIATADQDDDGKAVDVVSQLKPISAADLGKFMTKVLNKEMTVAQVKLRATAAKFSITEEQEASLLKVENEGKSN